MSQVATNANDLDIHDGTLPIEDAAQTEADATEETAQIDDDGDVDGSQVSEAETADESTDTAEATEEAPATEDKAAPKPEAKPEAKPAATFDDYAKAIASFREEFGAEAAAGFEMIAKKAQSLEAALNQIAAEREAYARRSDQQIAAQHMSAGGIDATKHETVYADAVDYFELRKKQGKAVDGMAALKWAIRANGGNPDPEKPAAKPSPKAEKAEKLEKLRSVPPKARAASAPVDFDDPAVADGTAPRRSS